MKAQLSILKDVFLVLTLIVIVISAGCGTRLAREVDFILPVGFEGPVVVLTGVKTNIPARIVDGSLKLEVPPNGIVVSDISRDEYQTLKLNYFTNDGTLIPYLYSRTADAPEGELDFERLTQDERSNRLFVMRHSVGSFEAYQGTQQFFSFVVGFPDKVNLYAGSILPTRVREAGEFLITIRGK